MPPPSPFASPDGLMAATAQFAQGINAHLARLQAHHAVHLSSCDEASVQGTVSHARTLRRAAIVHRAASEILVLPEGNLAATATARAFLRSVLPRLQAALREADFARLASLASSTQTVLDTLVVGEAAVFGPLDEVPASAIAQPYDAASPGAGPSAAATAAAVTRSAQYAGGEISPLEQPAAYDDDYDDADAPFGEGQTEGTRRRGKKTAMLATTPPAKAAAAAAMANDDEATGCCPISCTDLSGRGKIVLALYTLMVLGATIAIAVVTIDFARQQINPGAFIQSEVTDSLESPVVTVCLSQPGVPFSRLQFFNFSDAEGTNFVGTNPTGSQDEVASPEFKEVVERFWDNPDNEDCTAKVGDFFPFPLVSIQNLMDGKETTRCRQCYRVGSRHTAIARSTSFQNSSVLSLFTDNYYLQCVRSTTGLNKPSMDRLHATLIARKADLERLKVLTTEDGQPKVSELDAEAFQKVTSVQACNIFYFSFFPKALGKEDPDVDVKYKYDGEKWVEDGTGPYLRQRTKSQGFLPDESLQLFVETKESARPGSLSVNRDMILIGPNTQTFATFRPVIVYGEDRYDISSSTSNLWQNGIEAIFGYWLVYKVYYNYNRFVTDEWYRESTYPVSQWIVDVTGYASLFTGASLFSLLLLPLLRTMRRRERQRLLQKRPDAYLWSRHRRRFQETGGFEVSAQERMDPLSGDEMGLSKKQSVLLPGYNV